MSVKREQGCVSEPPPDVAVHGRLARASDWLLPLAARVGGGYFANGVARAVCRGIYEGARRHTLYRFAPPPPLRLAAHARHARGADAYSFRSPFVSPWRMRNDATMYHYRGHGPRRPLVLVNLGAGSVTRAVTTRRFVASLLAAGVDVAVPVAPGTGSRRDGEDRRRGWAHSVGAALSAVVQLVHDDVAVEAWARERDYRTVIACGFGLGGTVAALLAATTTRFDAYVPLLTGAHPGRIWLPPRPLARAVHRRALLRHGVRHHGTLARLFDPIAPIRLPPPRAGTRCVLIALRADSVVPPIDVRDLARHWTTRPIWLPHARVELSLCAPRLAGLVAGIALATAR